MNIFTICSWYPSKEKPARGMFYKEQVKGMALAFPESNFGISLWGQNEEENLLYLKDHFKNLFKIFKFYQKDAYVNTLSYNIYELYSPCLTWSRKIKKGNIAQQIRANEANLKAFENRVGKIDIIHAHVGYSAGYIGMMLSRKYSIPFTITEHLDPFPTTYYLKENGRLSKILDEPLKTAHMVIAENNSLVQTMQNFRIKNVICIPNMVNEDSFYPEDEFFEDEFFVFFFLGELIERKGIFILIEALELLKSEKIVLKIGGEGVKMQDLKDYAKRLGVEEKISWLGFINKNVLRNEFNRCHCFVLPSLSENLGMVLLEAIACGKPIIASRCGGPEMIVNDENGLLVDTNDANDLAKAMLYMKENYLNYSSKLIRETFLNKFSRKIVAKQIMEVYQNIISKN